MALSSSSNPVRKLIPARNAVLHVSEEVLPLFTVYLECRRKSEGICVSSNFSVTDRSKAQWKEKTNKQTNKQTNKMDIHSWIQDKDF